MERLKLDPERLRKERDSNRPLPTEPLEFEPGKLRSVKDALRRRSSRFEEMGVPRMMGHLPTAGRLGPPPPTEATPSPTDVIPPSTATTSATPTPPRPTGELIHTPGITPKPQPLYKTKVGGMVFERAEQEEPEGPQALPEQPVPTRDLPEPTTRFGAEFEEVPSPKEIYRAPGRFILRVGRDLKQLATFITLYKGLGPIGAAVGITWNPGPGMPWEDSFWSESGGPLSSTIRELFGKKEIRKAWNEGNFELAEELVRERLVSSLAKKDLRISAPAKKGELLEHYLDPVSRYAIENPLEAIIIMLGLFYTAKGGKQAFDQYAQRVGEKLRERHRQDIMARERGLGAAPPEGLPGVLGKPLGREAAAGRRGAVKRAWNWLFGKEEPGGKPRAEAGPPPGPKPVPPEPPTGAPTAPAGPTPPKPKPKPAEPVKLPVQKEVAPTAAELETENKALWEKGTNILKDLVGGGVNPTVQLLTQQADIPADIATNILQEYVAGKLEAIKPPVPVEEKPPVGEGNLELLLRREVPEKKFPQTLEDFKGIALEGKVHREGPEDIHGSAGAENPFEAGLVKGYSSADIAGDYLMKTLGVVTWTKGVDPRFERPEVWKKAWESFKKDYDAALAPFKGKESAKPTPPKEDPPIPKGPSRLDREQKIGHASKPAKKTFALMPDGKKVYFQFRAVSLDSLILTEKLQPRNRDRAALKVQVMEMAGNFLVDKVLHDTRELSTGPPRVSSEGEIISGHGRIEAIKELRANHPKRWAQYLEQSLAYESTHGISGEELQKIQEPVIVLEVVGETDLVKLAEASNVSEVADSSIAEEVGVLAKKIDNNTLLLYEPGEGNSVETLMSAANRDFVQVFLKKLDKNQRGSFLDSKGQLSPEGANRILAAMYHKIYRAGQNLVESFFGSLDLNVRNVKAGVMNSIGAMAEAEGMMRTGGRPKELTIVADVNVVVEKMIGLRREGTKVSDYLKQTTLFGKELTPFQLQVIAEFDARGKSALKLKELLVNYADNVMGQADPKQSKMFGDTPLTKEELFEKAAHGPQGSLFGGGGGGSGTDAYIPNPSERGWLPWRWGKAQKEHTLDRDQMIRDASKVLGMPWRYEYMKGKKAAAYYISRDMVARARRGYYADVETFSHELGHHLHKFLYGLTPGGRLLTKGSPLMKFKKELLELSYKDIHGKGKVKEGLAEFVRHYLTIQDRADLKKRAPLFYAWFERDFLGKIAPEMRGAMVKLRRQWEDYQRLDWKTRMKLWVRGSEKPRMGLSFNELKRHLIDQHEGVKRIQRLMTEGKKLDPDRDMEVMMDLLAGAHGMAEAWINKNGAQVAFGMEGEKIGPSLEDIMDPIGERMDDLELYGLALQAASRKESHGWDIEGHWGFYEKDVYKAIEKLQSPEFDKAIKEWRGWNANLVRYVGKAARLPDAWADRIIAQDPFYVPAFRLYEAEVPMFGQEKGFGSNMASAYLGVGRRKGANLPIAAPYETSLRNAFVILKRALEFRILNIIVDDAKAYGKSVGIGNKIGSGNFIEGPLPEKMQQAMTPAADVLKKLDDRLKLTSKLKEEYDLKDLVDEIADDWLPIFIPSLWKPKAPYLTILRGGKVGLQGVRKNMETYWFHPDLYKSFSGFYHDDANALTRSLPMVLMRKGTRLRRAGIVTHIRFQIKNQTRDLVSAYIRAANFFKLVLNLPEAWKEVYTGGELYQKFKAGGTSMATFFQRDTKDIVKGLEERMARKGQKIPGLRSAIRHPIRFMEKMGEIFESATRLAEMMALGLKEAKTSKELFNISIQGRRITVDFGQGGTTVIAVSPYSMFWKAKINGLRWTYHTATENPGRFTRRGLTAIALPTILYWMYSNLSKNKDCWRNYPGQQKDRNWVFWAPWQDCKKGDDPYRFPKPHEIGWLFATSIEAILETYRTKDPRVLWRSLVHMVKDVVPVPEPTAVMPVIESAMNYQIYWERPIEPRELQGLLPQYRATARTSETFRMIGRMAGMSPSRLEHLFLEYTETMGWFALESADEILIALRIADRRRRPKRTPGSKIIAGAFRGTWPRLTTEPVEHFWELWNRKAFSRFDFRWPGMVHIEETIGFLEKQGKDGRDEAKKVRAKFKEHIRHYEYFKMKKTQMKDVADRYYHKQEFGNYTPEELREMYDAMARKYNRYAIQAVNKYMGYERYTSPE